MTWSDPTWKLCWTSWLEARMGGRKKREPWPRGRVGAVRVPGVVADGHDSVCWSDACKDVNTRGEMHRVQNEIEEARVVNQTLKKRKGEVFFRLVVNGPIYVHVAHTCVGHWRAYVAVVNPRLFAAGLFFFEEGPLTLHDRFQNPPCFRVTRSIWEFCEGPQEKDPGGAKI